MATLNGEGAGHPMVVEQIARIVTFLNNIGIPTAEATLPEDTVLPAMTVRDGVLLYDPARLERPGDLLHEGGHIAVTDPALRATVSDFDEDRGGDEMAATAWSWAAAIAAGSIRVSRSTPTPIAERANGFRKPLRRVIISVCRYCNITGWHAARMTKESNIRR